jgi:serine/threonine protein kinase
MSATQPLGVDSSPPSSEVAVRQQLDALAKGEIDHVTFLNTMKERFRYEPDDNWEVLSLLDQYYRRGKITLEVFRALKSGFAEYILGPQIPAPSPQSNAPTLHTVVTPPTKAAAAAAAPPAPAPSVTAPVARAPAASAPPISASTITRESQSYAFTDDTVQIPMPAAFAAATAASAPAPAREAQIGDVLRNRFRLEGLLGRGASGNVFDANDPLRLNLPPLGKRIAIKVVRSPDPRGIFINQLRQEFHHLQLLSHPNVVRAFDFDRDGAFAFFTMELLNGDHLSRLVRARGASLRRAYALAIIRDVGAAVAYAHSRGIAHGDINPQNVFITTRGEVRVLGFGASNKLAGNAWAPDFEHASAVPDTAKYASSEVLQGNRPDASDDLYSLSCLAYLVLAGKHPFADLTAVEARAERRRPRRPRGLTYRQWLTLRAGLQIDAKKRPSDVQAWLDGMELQGAAKQLPAASELMDSPMEKSSSWPWVMAGLLIAALLGGGYWLYTNQDIFGSQTAQPTAEGQSAAPAGEPSAGAPPASLNAPPAAAPGAGLPPSPRATAGSQTSRSSLPGSPAPSATAPAAAPKSIARSAAPPPPAGIAAATAPASSSSRTAAAQLAAAPPAAVASGPAASHAAATPAPARVEMAVDAMDALPTDTVVRVTVRRKGNMHGPTSFTWWTESGTAKPGVDFSPVLPHVLQMQDGETSTVLSVVVLPTVRAQPKGFYVGIEEADGGARIGARSLTQITLPPTN